MRSQHVEAFGPDLGPVFHELWHECAWLQIKWQQYEALYGTNSERVDLLNRAASLFFRVVQDSLWDDILLHLSALTDPPKSAGKGNLTLRLLPDLVEDELLRKRVSEFVFKAVAATEFARDRRNRRIAHRDLALAISNGAEPLAMANRKKVREAIESTCEVVRLLYREVLNSDLRFGAFREPHDGEALLYVLRDGIEAEEGRRQRMREGAPGPDDLRLPRPI